MIFRDDWDDGNVTDRTGGHQAIARDDNGCPHISRYRPEWEVVTGSPTAEGTGNGLLNLPAGDTTVQEIHAPNTQTIGTWTCHFSFSGTTSTGSFTIGLMRGESAFTYIETKWDGSYSLRHFDGSSATTHISGTWPDDTGFNRAWATRAADGSMTLGLDSGLEGSASSVPIPDRVDSISIRNFTDAAVEVYELLGY